MDQMIQETLVLFDGSLDGFFTVVFDVYYEKLIPIAIMNEEYGQLTLDCKSHTVVTDTKKADRVLTGICEKISFDAAEIIYFAFMVPDESRYMALLSYIRLGFKVGASVNDHLKDDNVLKVHKLAKLAGKEAHLLRGFCRFSETKQGVFYSPITPKNDVLPVLADHFTRRFMNHSWVIHDKTRNKAAIYDGKKCIITDVPRDATVDLMDGEEETRGLWMTFFDNLTIKERSNKKLQRQLLPLYFRGNMTEFWDREVKPGLIKKA